MKIGLAAEFLGYVDQRAGLLVGQGGTNEGRLPKTYTFPHRTFQEYLAGCHMAGDWNALDVYWRHAGESDAWYLAAVLGCGRAALQSPQCKGTVESSVIWCRWMALRRNRSGARIYGQDRWQPFSDRKKFCV